MSYFDFDTYKRTNYGPREGKCYIIRKGETRTDLPREFDGPVIDNLSEKEKVEWFNKCEYCISYDTQTAYSQIASLCGCVSVVVPEKGKCRENYRKGTEDIYDTGYGEAFGFSEEEINYSIDTREVLIKMYENLEKESIRNVQYFVKECENFFGNKTELKNDFI